MAKNLKLTPKDTLEDCVVKLTDGNPGAMEALLRYINQYPVRFHNILMLTMHYLDSLEIYGSDIYVLWNDKCKRDNHKFFLLLRSATLNYFPRERIKTLSKDHAYKINIPEEDFWEMEMQILGPRGKNE